MNLSIFKTPVMLLFLAASFCFCKKKYDVICPPPISDENCAILALPVHDEHASIVGKWKLITRKSNSRPQMCFDYCPYNIVFEFKSNNVLTVSGDRTQLPSSVGFVLYPATEDEFYYSFVESNGWGEWKILLKIESSNIYVHYRNYIINSNELCFYDNGHYYYYFIKIK